MRANFHNQCTHSMEHNSVTGCYSLRSQLTPTRPPDQPPSRQLCHRDVTSRAAHSLPCPSALGGLCVRASPSLWEEERGAHRGISPSANLPGQAPLARLRGTVAAVAAVSAPHAAAPLPHPHFMASRQHTVLRALGYHRSSARAGVARDSEGHGAKAPH